MEVVDTVGILVGLAATDVVLSKLHVTAEMFILTVGGFPFQIGNILRI